MDHKKRSFLLILLGVCLCSQAYAWASWGEQWQSYGETDLDYYIQQPDPYYDVVCTAKDRCVTSCDSNYKKGCVCYNDGSCYEQKVNRCHLCTDPSVFAVFEGKKCPKRNPYICSHHKKKSGRRSHRGGFAECSNKKYDSCICSEDGTCSRRKVDLCSVCQKQNYLAIFINSTCPDSSLKAKCNSTFSPLPPPTTCNNPNAYTCTDDDRTSVECNLVSSGVSCVCYKNGTCLSQPSSACECQRLDVVSVTNGSYCPTNCTNNASADVSSEEEGEEEGESEGEEEGESEGESENENENENENEAESEAEEEESSETSSPNIQNITNITNITNVTPVAPPVNPNNQIANVTNVTNITNASNQSDQSNPPAAPIANQIANITNITNQTA